MNRRALIALCLVSFCSPLMAQEAHSANWSPKAAAGYLDNRIDWWMNWPKSARDHETFCVSCHTAVPYAISRLQLRKPLGETSESAPEKQLLANVSKRVSIWNEAEPFYSDKDRGANKTLESRGTESVLNAIILVTNSPKDKLSEPASAALANMWAQQLTSGEHAGSFPWLEFHNRPWEADDSPYYGAVMAAVAVGSAPADYRARPEIKEHIAGLRTYLQREFQKQSALNRVLGLWADAKIQGILTVEQRGSFIDEIYGLQRPDGGWTLPSIAGVWKRHDDTPQVTDKSDGYATGLITFVLQQTGVSRKSPKLLSGMNWLEKNQDKSEGLWQSWSLNKNRTDKEAGLFMSDAATAYSVMSLTY